MSKRRKRTYTHLDIEGRKVIEKGLNEKRTLSYIATELSVAVSTVRREIVRNRKCEFASTAKGADRSDCVHLGVCKRKYLCADCRQRLLCKRCVRHKCDEVCPDYELRICKITERSPFTCNSCERYGRCTLIRYRYSAEVAHAAATNRSIESRNGADITKEELDVLEQTVRAGLKLGQSIHHIFATSELPISERTFYRYVEDEVVSIKNIELAKKVKYKKRKSAKKSHQSGFYAGHEYEDYLMLDEEDRAATTIVDTVWGTKRDGKCILSLHRTDLHFQIFLLLKARTKECVVEAFDWLEECCTQDSGEGVFGTEYFEEYFGLLLCDRGSEFDDIKGIERSSINFSTRSTAYYADPSRPDQRGAGEKNHVELRKILPKGTSLENLDAWTLAEICSHVNSTVRKGCGNTSPMKLAQMVFPQSILDNLGLTLIPPKDVISAPGILYRP